MTIYMYIATLAWLSMIYGYIKRFNRKSHVPFVLTGITLDILLVLYLQITRDAVGTAMEFSLKPLEQIHILFSTIALLCYFPTLYFGFKLLFGLGTGSAKSTTKKRHMQIAQTALFFRTLGFFFMFSMWK